MFMHQMDVSAAYLNSDLQDVVYMRQPEGKEDFVDIKLQIAQEFEVVDGGELKHFLGMEIERDGETGSVAIGHKQYIDGLLRDYGMEDCKPNATPLENLCVLEDCPRANQKQYLLYLAMTTRPDIVHCVAKLAQTCSDPHKEHEVAAKRVLRYLKGTSSLKLHFVRNGVPVHCFVDADWAGDCTDRKSFSGWAFFLAGAAFSWESKKQSIIALSSTEAEYVALSTAAKESAYVLKLISEMGFETAPTLMIYSDNQSAQYAELRRNPQSQGYSTFCFKNRAIESQVGRQDALDEKASLNFIRRALQNLLDVSLEY
ncbi:uncharacterized protein [Drosophila bipectinata]|uniref:uncharacterized protein n=1 Tax=Drosophila bipectinata TaxID=42026 RepID=UPI0038B3498C